MITGNLSVDLLVLYVPALLAIVMGILGVVRGARREAVVSGSIVLASLIILVWATSWAIDLTGIFTGLSPSGARNALAYVVMTVIVLLVGYLFSSAIVPRTPTSALSRLGGLLIGIANGLAIGGFFIRQQFDTAVLSGGNSDLAASLTSNNIARYLWIWANWFPLVVAIIAGIVAIIGPFRRAQTAIATPPAGTDWGPSTAPAVGAVGAAPIATPGPAAYTTGYGPGFTSQQPQYGQQYGQAPNQPQPYAASGQPYSPYQPQPAPPPPAAPPSSSPLYSASSYTPAPPTNPRLDDAPPTAHMPPSDLPHSTRSGGQETNYFGSTPSATPSDTGSQPKSPDWPAYGNEPSWLTSTPPAPSAASPGSGAPSSPPVDSSLVSRAEAPTLAQPILTPATDDAGALTPSQPDDGAASLTDVNCPRCGTLVPSDATFCTECGNRLKTA
ncbi:MAG: zinc ribbon domain-containing protein [Chloroflexia bacterium]